MNKFNKPLAQRPVRKDEEVRQAGLITGDEQPKGSRYIHYEPNSEQSLDGKRIHRGQMFTPDRPGTYVPMPNDGPATRWPGEYPTKGAV